MRPTLPEDPEELRALLRRRAQERRRTLPEDPEELRALFQRRAQERDKRRYVPHETPEEDTTPEVVSPNTRNKQPRRKTKPFRVIRLTVEESRAIDEGRLSVEELKDRDANRDDGITVAQRTAEPRSRSQTKTGPDTRTGRVHETGPEETPAGAGIGRETAQGQGVGQAGHQQVGQAQEEGQRSPQSEESGQASDMGQTSPRPKTGPDARTAQVHKAGPEESPAETGTDRESDQVQEEDRTGEDRESAQVNDEDQARHRREPSPSLGKGRSYETGPDENPTGVGTFQTSPRPRSGSGTSTRRVHGTAPDEPAREAGGDGEPDRSHAREQASHRQKPYDQASHRQGPYISTGTGRAHETDPDVIPTGAGTVHERGPDHGQGQDRRKDHAADAQDGAAGQRGAVKSRATAVRDDALGGPAQQTSTAQPGHVPHQARLHSARQTSPAQQQPEHADTVKVESVDRTTQQRVESAQQDSTSQRRDARQQTRRHSTSSRNERQQPIEIRAATVQIDAAGQAATIGQHEPDPRRPAVAEAAQREKVGNGTAAGQDDTTSETTQKSSTSQMRDAQQLSSQHNTRQSGAALQQHEPSYTAKHGSAKETPQLRLEQQQPGDATPGVQDEHHRSRDTTPGPHKPGYPGNRDASPEARSAGQLGSGHKQARAQDRAGRRTAHEQDPGAEPEAEEGETGNKEAPTPPHPHPTPPPPPPPQHIPPGRPPPIRRQPTPGDSTVRGASGATGAGAQIGHTRRKWRK